MRRQLGVFDATMLVMGGIVGSGIFMNPSVVARHVGTPFLILGVWVAGGALALLGAFIWAELATRLPGAGGQYLYLREAYHPAVAFVYGWVLLLVTQTGGMAAVAVTFARYYREISGVTWSDSAIAAAVLLGLTAINCLGARAGSNVQSALMLLKMGAIAAMVAAGMALGGGTIHPLPLLDRPVSLGLLGAIGAAAIPVAFAYGGWQTATFVAGEMRNPGRDLSRGLVAGVVGVVVLYLAVNVVCLKVLGPEGLAATRTPATAVMRAAMGERGAWWIAVGIAISTLGFLSQGMLTAPRVYNAMARDGLFFESVGRLSARTGAPVTAIVLQGIAATAIAFSGKYEQILNYEVSVDFISFSLAAGALFLFRRQGRGVRGDCGEYGDHRPDQQRARMGHHVNGSSGVLVLEAPARGAMRRKQSEYMHWAKTGSRARYNLATSGVGPFPLGELGGLPPLEINGDNSYGYAPLKRAIAERHGVDADCVVTAAGTSGANYLAFATLLEAGDEVLIEHPTYGLLVDALEHLGTVVKRFPRTHEGGYAVDPEAVRRAITPRTRLIVLTNLHNPSSVLTPESVLREIGEVARSVGARVLVDEVYLDAVYRNTPRTSFHLGPRFVVTSSLTKVYGVSGLRCGWILAEADLAQCYGWAQEQSENLHMQNATWLVSRELTEEAGPWDTRLDYDQDGEYFCRVLLASEGTRFVPEARVFYRLSDSNRISYIGNSDKKKNSLVRSMRLHVQYIRSLEDSERVRKACLNYLHTWYENFYPDRPDIIAELQSLAAELQGRLEEPRLRWKYAWMKPILGWKAAKWAQRMLPETKASLLKRWDKAMFEFETRKASR